MSKDEIIKIAGIMMSADGGCSNCASELLKKLDEAFPGHAATIDFVWQDEYPDCEWKS